MTIRIPERSDTPTEDGRYLVVQSGTRSPLLAHWSSRDEWRSGGRKLVVIAWEGPIDVVMEDML